MNEIHTATGYLVEQMLPRLLLAAVLGGIIGLERELHHKSAGLRTHLFICFGSAFFTILSVQLASQFTGDHTRIAAQIIPGIGFIGAGSILHSRGSVSGLTTAATMFVVASIGMACGGGLYVSAVFATLIILLCLVALGMVEVRFDLKSRIMFYEVQGDTPEHMVSAINELLDQEHKVMQGVQITRMDGHYKVMFGVEGTKREHSLTLGSLRRLPKLKDVELLGASELPE